jgi:hypothetical protein
MSLNNKANIARTKLLLKSSQEIQYFTSLKMKINSISPKKLYESYNNIEITIENPCIFSTSQRKYTTFIDDSIVKNEFENSPLLEPTFKINKMLVSFKKNKTFYDTIEKNEIDNQTHKFSQDTNDTSISILERNNDLIDDLIDNKKDDLINISIHFLRKTAKNLIDRKRHKKKSKSFYKIVAFKSHGNLASFEKKNLNQIEEKHKHSIKSVNKKKKTSLNKETIVENSPIIYSSSQYAPSIHSGISFNKNNLTENPNNLFCKNQTSKISFNDNISNTNRSSIMNIPYEYDELVANTKRKNFKKYPPKQTM